MNTGYERCVWQALCAIDCFPGAIKIRAIHLPAMRGTSRYPSYCFAVEKAVVQDKLDFGQSARAVRHRSKGTYLVIIIENGIAKPSCVSFDQSPCLIDVI